MFWAHFLSLRLWIECGHLLLFCLFFFVREAVCVCVKNVYFCCCCCFCVVFVIMLLCCCCLNTCTSVFCVVMCISHVYPHFFSVFVSLIGLDLSFVPLSDLRRQGTENRVRDSTHDPNTYIDIEYCIHRICHVHRKCAHEFYYRLRTSTFFSA